MAPDSHWDSLTYWGLGRVSAEDPNGYCEGGYCPLSVQDKIANRFRIVHKLGHGGFATVWLAREEATGHYVALKVVVADQSETYELLPGLLPFLRKHPELFVAESERFFIESVNGRHLCQVLPVVGPALVSLTDLEHKLRPKYLRDFMLQVLRSISLMHSNGFCHGGEFMLHLYPRTRLIRIEQT